MHSGSALLTNSGDSASDVAAGAARLARFSGLLEATKLVRLPLRVGRKLSALHVSAVPSSGPSMDPSRTLRPTEVSSLSRPILRKPMAISGFISVRVKANVDETIGRQRLARL